MTGRQILNVKELHTYFYARSKRAFVRSVDGVSFDIEKGQTLGIVGESGSGKSVTALSVMGLVPNTPGVISGAIGLNTKNSSKNLLDGLSDYTRIHRQDNRIMTVKKDTRRWQKKIRETMKGVRGRRMAMIFQDPRKSMNPFTAIGNQIKEAILLNTPAMDKKGAKEKALYWLEQVRMDAPQTRYHNNPFGLSGGMCQRAMIAMALAAEPDLLIADEPTTGLDATIQSRIVNLLQEIKAKIKLTTLVISHDMGVIHRLADQVAVMYGGTILEKGPVQTVLDPKYLPKHPYTKALLASVPDTRLIRTKGYLNAIRGDVPDAVNIPCGCRFYPRCSKVSAPIQKECENIEPDLETMDPGHKVRCWQYV